MTVVSTIHSPSAKTFATFDDLFLLVGGRVTYFGPLADNALTKYFAAHGFNYAPPMNQVRGPQAASVHARYSYTMYWPGRCAVPQCRRCAH